VVGLLAGMPVPSTAVAASVAAVLVLPGHVGALLAPLLGFRPGGERGPGLRGRGLFRLLRYLPPWTWLAGGGLVLAFWFAAATVLLHNHGVPQMQDGRYVLVDRGTVTVVDRTTYERARVDDERAWLGVLGAFGVSGTMMCAASVARARAERSRLLGY
jgi:hypothetical protein